MLALETGVVQNQSGAEQFDEVDFTLVLGVNYPTNRNFTEETFRTKSVYFRDNFLFAGGVEFNIRSLEAGIISNKRFFIMLLKGTVKCDIDTLGLRKRKMISDIEDNINSIFTLTPNTNVMLLSVGKKYEYKWFELGNFFDDLNNILDRIENDPNFWYEKWSMVQC
jgi:hypothetical protein